MFPDCSEHSRCGGIEDTLDSKPSVLRDVQVQLLPAALADCGVTVASRRGGGGPGANPGSP